VAKLAGGVRVRERRSWWWPGSRYAYARRGPVTFDPPSLPSIDDDEEEEFTSQRQCVDCRTFAPRTRTAHTLISAQFGWRLSRTALASGEFLYEWRCPACFTKYRDKRGPAGAPPSARGR
jgi:hypothetical protein